MDLKTLYQFVYDSLNGNYDDYTVEELIAEAEDYYPDLIRTRIITGSPSQLIERFRVARAPIFFIIKS